MTPPLRDDNDDRKRWERWLSAIESKNNLEIDRFWIFIYIEIRDIVYSIKQDQQLRQFAVEDLIQTILLKLQDPDVLLRVLRSNNPSGYLRTMVRNLIIDLHRRTRRERKVFREFLRQRLWRRKPSAPTQKAQRLEEILVSLSSADRAIVELRYGQNLSVKEIAARLGLSYSAAGARLCRLKSKLRQELNG